MADSEDDWGDADDEFLAAVDELEAQHKKASRALAAAACTHLAAALLTSCSRSPHAYTPMLPASLSCTQNTQQPPQLRASQPASPLPPPPPRQAPPAGGPVPFPQQPFVQPQHQHPVTAPLQQINGVQQLGGAPAQHKPPMPSLPRPGAAPPAAYGGLPRPAPSAAPGLPAGHVSRAAAELQAQMALGGRQQPGGVPGAPPGQEAMAAQLAHVQTQYQMQQRQMQQKDQEIARLRQQVQQLESAARGGQLTPAQQQQLAELQRQLQAARNEMVFKDQEVGAGEMREARTRA